MVNEYFLTKQKIYFKIKASDVLSRKGHLKLVIIKNGTGQLNEGGRKIGEREREREREDCIKHTKIQRE